MVLLTENTSIRILLHENKSILQLKIDSNSSISATHVKILLTNPTNLYLIDLKPELLKTQTKALNAS